MTLQELVRDASRGCHRDEETGRPGMDEIMSSIEIMTKGKELSEEINTPERWDKDIIARKCGAIIWFCARMAGMYGVNLEDAVRKKAEEAKTESPPLEKPAASATQGKANAKIIYGPQGKPAALSRAGKPPKRARRRGAQRGPSPNT